MPKTPTNIIGADTSATPEEKVARIVSDVPREKIVPLDWPVEFDGKVYMEVRIKRATAKEMRDFVQSLQADVSVVPPVFDIPVEVYDALDADDADKLDKAGFDFLPQRLRGSAN